MPPRNEPMVPPEVANCLSSMRNMIHMAFVGYESPKLTRTQHDHHPRVNRVSRTDVFKLRLGMAIMVPGDAPRVPFVDRDRIQKYELP